MMCNHDLIAAPSPQAFLRGLAVWLAALVVAALSLSGCVTDGDEEPWSVGVGDACPRFELVLSDGSKVTTDDLAGKRTMIVFFNTGCEDCQRELPEIQRVADQLAIEGVGHLAGSEPVPQGVPSVICVSRGEGEPAVARYWAENALSLPYSAQDDAAVYHLFAESLIPRIYIIGVDLTVEASYAETLPSAETLLRQMRQR